MLGIDGLINLELVLRKLWYRKMKLECDWIIYIIYASSFDS